MHSTTGRPSRRSAQRSLWWRSLSRSFPGPRAAERPAPTPFSPSGQTYTRTLTRAWCNGCTRAFQALSTGSIPVARFGRKLTEPRGVAQFGSAFGWGPKGRWFKSSRPD
jgi:hypothetical protein